MSRNKHNTRKVRVVGSGQHFIASKVKLVVNAAQTGTLFTTQGVYDYNEVMLYVIPSASHDWDISITWFTDTELQGVANAQISAAIEVVTNGQAYCNVPIKCLGQSVTVTVTNNGGIARLYTSYLSGVI